MLGPRIGDVMVDSLDNHISLSHMDMSGFGGAWTVPTVEFWRARRPLDVRTRLDVRGRNEL